MYCAFKCFYRLGKTVPKTVKLTKEIYEQKCFGAYTIFRWNENFIKGRFSAALKPNSRKVL